jgi:ankyrin repeat protein
MQSLLDARASISAASNRGGFTPLHTAAVNGRAEAVRLLLVVDAAGQRALSNEAKERALLCAAERLQMSAVRALLAAGVDINCQWTRDDHPRRNSNELDHLQGTALHVVARHLQPHSIRELLSLGAHVDALDQRGLTPLFFVLQLENLRGRYLAQPLAFPCIRALLDGKASLARRGQAHDGEGGTH